MLAELQKCTPGGPLIRQILTPCLINLLARQGSNGYCGCVHQSGDMYKKHCHCKLFHCLSILTFKVACLGQNATEEWIATFRIKTLQHKQHLKVGAHILLREISQNHKSLEPGRAENSIDHSSSCILRGGWKTNQPDEVKWGKCEINLCALLISPQAHIDHVEAVYSHSRDKGGGGMGRWEMRVSEGVVVIRHSH